MILKPDIPHRLVHVHEYSTIQSRLGLAEQLKQLLMWLSEMHHQEVPLPRNAEDMNPTKVLEPPACCRILHRSALVVGKRRVMVLERLTNTVLSGGRHQPAHGHHHEEGHDPCGLFERARGGQKLGVFQETTPTFGMSLPCVSVEHLLGRQRRLIPCIGGQDETAVLIDQRLTRREGGGEGAFDRRDHSGGLGVRTWSPPLAIAWRGTYGDRGEACRRSAVLNGRQRLVCLRFTGESRATQWCELFDFLVTLLAPLRVDRALCLGVAMLRGEEQPAWRDPARRRGQDVITIPFGEQGQGRRVGLRQRGLCLTQRCRDTGHPLHRGLGKLLEVVRMIEGTIRDEIGGAIGRLSRCHRLLDDVATGFPITRMATEGWHQDRNTSLMLDHQLQHHVVEVRPMIAAVASGHVNDLRLGLLLTVILSIDVNARALEMGKGGSQAQSLGGGGRDGNPILDALDTGAHGREPRSTYRVGEAHRP